MAVRWQNDAHTHGRVPGYYARNRIYPGAYARTDWQTRTSRRIHDGLAIDKNFGLDTTSDDINSSPYSSPYYVNGRYNAGNLTTQRGNSSSVQGIKKLLSIHDRKEDFSDEDVQTTLELWQGKQIKFEMPYNGKIVGNTISIKNTDMCHGILSIYLSAKENGQPICESSVNLCDISPDKFEHIELTPSTVFPAKANPLGKVYVRLEIWDEIKDERSENPFNTGRKIEIASTGKGNHYACEYELGDKNMPVKEEYNYERFPSRPLIGLIYNDWESIPTDKIENEKVGATVSLNGYRYDLFTIKDDTHAEMVVYDKQMNRVINSTIKVDGRTTEVYVAQCADWIYYVDGYSPLQKFKIGEWVSQALPIAKETDTEDANPVLAPGIIVLHNNRIYLSKFRYDVNLVQISAIDAAGPVYDQLPYRIYVPNNNPRATSLNPITAIVESQSDTLMIAGRNSVSLFTSNRNIEDGTPQQTSIFTDSSGVASQGDICNYKGVIYSFDQDEGIRRFTGSIWNKVPASVGSHFDRVDMDKPRKLWGYANKLYFNYIDKIDGKRKALVWDMDMNYQQYPWFQDTDIPFCDVRIADDYDLTGIHPDYPCIMQHYAEDTWRRMDSPITFERHTKYLSLPGNAADAIIKRVHTKVLANADRWWYLSLSYDKQALEQTRGKDDWYRMPVWDTKIEEEPVETPFPLQDEYEEDAVFRMTLSHLRIQCSAIQEKVKVKTFRSQANLISTVFESGVRQYN